jgi:hypothetical protein
MWRMRALEGAHQEREALETWDPAAGGPGSSGSAAQDALRRQLLAADRSGHLSRARVAALRAKTAAQTPVESFRGTLLLLTIEHELGDHTRELEQARALRELQPDSSLAADMLRRALECTRRQRRANQPSPASAAGQKPSPVPGSHAQALREARRLWGAAIRAVKPEMDAWAEQNPEATAAVSAEPLRRQFMARDQSGLLHRAREAGRQARKLARTPEERFQATYLLAILECDAGHHQVELQLVRHLLRLAPSNGLSLLSLRRAARCNGEKAIEKQADMGLEELQFPMTRPDGSTMGPVIPRYPWEAGGP